MARTLPFLVVHEVLTRLCAYGSFFPCRPDALQIAVAPGGVDHMTSPPRDSDASRPARRDRGRRTFGRVLVLGVALVVVLSGTAAATAAAAAPPATPGATNPDLGPNVIVFDSSMPVGEIRATADAIYARQVDDEMGSNRYALLFKPGVYGTDADPLQLKVGYYTEVAGLGASPSDVVINGKVEVYNRCLANGGTGNCVALVNFWRTLRPGTASSAARG
jgi:hypothetical protein